MLDFIKNIFSTGTNEVLKTVTGLVDNVFTSQEEKDAFKLEFEKTIRESDEKKAKLVEESYQKELEVWQKDMADARSREIQLNTSTNSSWLSKNIVSLIATVIVVSTIILFFTSIIGKLNSSDSITMLVINSSTGFVSLVVGYYFGSSNPTEKK